jgi:hypothetical protein
VDTPKTNPAAEVMRGIHSRPIFIALVVLLSLSGFILVVLATHDWDVAAFVVDRPVDAPASQTWGVGYDGQFAYKIALDPETAMSELDYPAFRFLRIVYPVLSRLIALGQPDLIPLGMVAVNLLAATVTAWLLAKIIQRRGGPAWAAYIGIFTFNYLIGIRMDLNEPLAFCLALAGLLAYEEGWQRSAVVIFAVAVMAKEIAIAFPAALALSHIWRREWKETLRLIGGSVLPYLLWAGFVGVWLNISPFDNHLARPSLIPFAGLFQLANLESQILIWMWMVLPALLVGVSALRMAIDGLPGTPQTETLLVLTNVLILATIPTPAWFDPVAVLRLGIGTILASIIWLAKNRPRFLRFAASLWFPSLLMIFLIPGFVF